MRTVWTMGFVAAAALSFCFPDFIVFRFTQAVIWSIALLGLVLLCGVSGQFSFAQAALFGVGGYSAAIIGAHTPFPVYVGLPLALLLGYAAGWGLGRIAGAYLALAGCLSSYQFGYVGPGSYGFALSVQMLFGLVIGGMYSPAGAIVGGLFLQFFPDLLAGLGKGLSGLLYAVLLIAAMVLMPSGVVGTLKRFFTSSPAKLGRWRRHTATEGS